MDVEPADDENLWQPPALPRRPAIGWVNDEISFYAKTTERMEKWWKAPVSQMVPVECRKATHWSLALLVQLKQLCNLTRKDMATAHDVLMLYWRQRQESRKSQGIGPTHVTSSTRHVVNGPRRNMLEEKIVEKTDGLMLADVREAISHVLNVRKTARDATKCYDEMTGMPKKVSKGVKRAALKNEMKSSLSKDQESSHRTSAKESELPPGFKGLEGTLTKLDMGKNIGDGGLKRVRREFKLRHRMNNKLIPKEAMLPSERSQPGDLPARSKTELDGDMFVSSMASLKHADPTVDAYAMRSTVMENMDEEDDTDDDDDKGVPLY